MKIVCSFDSDNELLDGCEHGDEGEEGEEPVDSGPVLVGRERLPACAAAFVDQPGLCSLRLPGPGSLLMRLVAGDRRLRGSQRHGEPGCERLR
ncbi:hypothetical protein HTZ77_29540 [Nonomuraea sp. SMC257]|uniref:Uncharacterized protein n=1 Tax=Nonomuraea montanisoli TaxID=2741721 RepID=A0A7Y6IDJ8_9ACTN|nr:hypothetical protein [Nonomuraea montanisoli]